MGEEIVTELIVPPLSTSILLATPPAVQNYARLKVDAILFVEFEGQVLNNAPHGESRRR
jgi:hypothetical protein